MTTDAEMILMLSPLSELQHQRIVLAGLGYSVVLGRANDYDVLDGSPDSTYSAPWCLRNLAIGNDRLLTLMGRPGVYEAFCVILRTDPDRAWDVFHGLRSSGLLQESAGESYYG